jgi:hypothetical protein
MASSDNQTNLKHLFIIAVVGISGFYFFYIFLLGAGGSSVTRFSEDIFFYLILPILLVLLAPQIVGLLYNWRGLIEEEIAAVAILLSFIAFITAYGWMMRLPAVVIVNNAALEETEQETNRRQMLEAMGVADNAPPAYTPAAYRAHRNPITRELWLRSLIPSRASEPCHSSNPLICDLADEASKIYSLLQFRGGREGRIPNILLLLSAALAANCGALFFFQQTPPANKRGAWVLAVTIVGSLALALYLPMF